MPVETLTSREAQKNAMQSFSRISQAERVDTEADPYSSLIIDHLGLYFTLC